MNKATKLNFYHLICIMSADQIAELQRLSAAVDRAWLQLGTNAQLQAQQELKAFTDSIVDSPKNIKTAA